MKRKVLSILLVVAVFATLFTGCGKTDDPGIDPTPTPSDKIGARPTYLDGVIEFNLYNEGDYLTRFTDTAKEWMLNNYLLKVGNSIPAIDGSMATASSRQAFNTSIANLFIAEATRPDYMPSLRASSVGTDACFKQLGPTYLVDLNPYLEEGELLESYVNWVWGDASKLGLWDNAMEYWETYKSALEVDGKLYAIPRRECMPVSNYLGYAAKLLEQINVSKDELPETWDGFIELLNKFKSYKNGAVPFVMYDGKLSGLMAFVASTYGLEFNEDFEWTQKNGEPLWTYYWDEYLQILKNVKDLAAQGLVKTDTKAGKGIVINYDFDYTQSSYKAYKSTSDMDAKLGNSIASYTTTTIFGIWQSHGKQAESLTGWTISDKMVAQEGKKASLYSMSSFDAADSDTKVGGYIAIGNRLGNEFALRIMHMLSYSADDTGFLQNFFGLEGTPFAEHYTSEGAGSFVYDENGKIRVWNEDRLGYSENIDFWMQKDQHAEYVDSFPYDYAEGVNAAEEYGITDTGFWPSRSNYRRGTMLVADVTAWPMKLTAYWSGEQMYRDEAAINAQMNSVNSNGSMVSVGFYMTPAEYIGGSEASVYENKISNLKTIAKNFTVDFLSGKKTESDWTAYIKNLEEAGYNDVYEFYKVASYGFSTTYDPNVESQTTVNNRK